MKLMGVNRQFNESVWAIDPSTYEHMSSVLEAHENSSVEDIKKYIALAEQKTYGTEEKPAIVEQGVAIINIHGPIFSRASMFQQISGYVNPQETASTIRGLAEDSSISHIVMDIDSGGGTVSGTSDLISAIRYAKTKKKVYGIANDSALSGAYWIGSACSELWISETGTVGSISVIMRHVSVAKAIDAAGIKVTYLRTGKNKALFQNEEDLTPAVEKKLLASMTKYHDIFVNSVASDRDLDITDVSWADGSTFVGQEAIDYGLADKIGTLSDLLQYITNKGTIMTKPESITVQAEPTVEVVKAVEPAAQVPSISPELQAQLDELKQLKAEKAQAQVASIRTELNVSEEVASSLISTKAVSETAYNELYTVLKAKSVQAATITTVLGTSLEASDDQKPKTNLEKFDELISNKMLTSGMTSLNALEAVKAENYELVEKINKGEEY